MGVNAQQSKDPDSIPIDFLDCIDMQIEKHPCHEVEGKA
jgi:hypothetical protein